jgi:hypothetical protein
MNYRLYCICQVLFEEEESIEGAIGKKCEDF